MTTDVLFCIDFTTEEVSVEIFLHSIFKILEYIKYRIAITEISKMLSKEYFQGALMTLVLLNS